MALPLIITLTFLISYITFFIKKKYSFLHNAILFMVMAIITKNYMTVTSMELKLIKHTEEYSLFLFLILHREIIIPLLILIYVNLRFRNATLPWAIFLFILILSLMQTMTYLTTYFEVVEFIKWNMFYALLANIAFMLIGLGISKSLVAISNWEGQQHDSNL
jgi:hypothetical protein